MSPYSPFPFSDFGGLDVASDPDESGCIDLLNVDLDARGSARSRDGFTQFTSTSLTGAYLFQRLVSFGRSGSTSGTIVGVIGDPTGAAGLVTVDSSGVITSRGTWGTLAPLGISMVRFGSPTLEAVYVSSGTLNANEQARRWDGTSLTTPAGSPTFLAVTPNDNRMVQAGFWNAADSPTGANGSQSTVFFSDAGAPETWSANNFVHLSPGDGERITGMVQWRDMLIVAKETHLFVFYGNSTDSSGNPVFNYRTVTLPAAAVSWSFSSSVVAGNDGVYVLTRSGVYLTTGGPARCISTAVNPIFTGRNLPGTFSGAAMANIVYGLNSGPRIKYVRDRVYIMYADTNGTARTLVYDTGLDTWMLDGGCWARDMAAHAISSVGERVMTVTANAKGLMYQAPGVTTDNGTAITSRWRSGFVALNWIRRSGHWLPINSQEATVRETIIDGTGTIKFSVSRDFGAVPTSAGGAKATVALGTSPAVAQGRHTIAQQGRRVSFQIEDDGTGSAWRVYGLTMHIEGARDPGFETS